ncbi:MAG: hypothetical protein H0T89_19145 [Deltaproteobacteria bacterium]|nr:hypothetical protein [Deltaproteobacteria bacterium]
MLAACGDNQTCEVPASPLPTEGELVDPYAMELPADCVQGGLLNLPGRWFFVDPSEIFEFSYPRFEGSCSEGFRRSFAGDDDHDPSDGGSRYTWSDGTRLFTRAEFRFQLPDRSIYTYTSASAFCVLSTNRIARATVTLATGYEPRSTHGIGTRFGRKDALADGLELVGEVGEAIGALNLVIDGSYAYVAGNRGLDIVDVTDASAPRHVANFDGSFNDVKVVHANGKLFAILAPRSGRTLIVDVTDEQIPRLVSAIPEYSHSLFLQTRGATTELYLATGESSVPKYDITNPLAPVRIGTAVVPGVEGSVHDLFVDGDRIYANNTRAGLVAFDVSAGLERPVELGRAPASYSHSSWVGTAGGRKIILHGDEGMTKTADGGAYLRVLDGDPASPKFMTDIGRYQTRPQVGIHNFEVHGDRAYIAYYQDGVRVVDLSDPTKPREIAHYNTWDPETAPGGAFEGALGVRVVGDLIYVADDLRGLLIFRKTP